MILQAIRVHRAKRCLLGLIPALVLGMDAPLGLPAMAQNITLDGTLGPVRALGNGPNYLIQQADGTTVGNNLFHSFGRFNLAAGEQAGFQSAAAIQNILARVTGGTPSSINGLIFTDSAAVNLFLINPAGIVFGPNARLDIGGTTRGDFTATTLDAIVWPDGSRFDAVNPGGAAPLLRIVGDPSRFLSSQRPIPGITVNQSQLQVYNTQGLRLLGGDIAVNRGQLDAWGGRVDIGSVAGTGTVELLGHGGFQFSSDVVRGDIQFADATQVDVTLGNGGDIRVIGRNIGVFSGSILRAGISPGFGTTSSQAGLLKLDATGTIEISGNSSRLRNDVSVGATGKGGDIELVSQNVLIRDTGGLRATTSGIGDAGDIKILASDFVLIQDGDIFNRVNTRGRGRGGDVIINTRTLEVQDGSQIDLSTFGIGDAGNLTIKADSYVLFEGVNSTGQFFSSAFSSNGGGQGNGGSIFIETPFLEVRDGAFITSSTFGQGSAGQINIRAGDRVLLKNRGVISSSVEPESQGRGGIITIATPLLEVLDGAQISADTFGIGDAGIIEIAAGNRILVQGFLSNRADIFPSRIGSNVADTGQGAGGLIAISSPILEVYNGGQISTDTSGTGKAGNVRIAASDRVLVQGVLAAGDFLFPSKISSDVNTDAQGDGGDVLIETSNLEVRDGAQITSGTNGIGNAGKITIIASASAIDGKAGRILVQGSSPDNLIGSAIGTGIGPNGQGGGGNLSLRTSTLELLDGAQVSASTFGTGDAGEVWIVASDGILLRGTTSDGRASSGIFSQVNPGGQGNAGDLVIDTALLEIHDGALISTATFGTGNSGNIRLTASDRILLQGTSYNGKFFSLIGSKVEENARGNGGDIVIETNGFEMRNGARILSGTSGNGDAGDIIINARSQANITNGLISSTSDSRFVSVSAGDIVVTTPILELNNSQLLAESDISISNDTNITLNLGQALIMRNGSLISATAGRAQGAGDGGNITINSPFVISLPGENNDIIANAFSGTGGNITINADSILNFTVNDSGKTFDQLRQQSTNDISASSQFGGSGILNLRGLNVNPAQGTVQLPSTTSSPQPSQGCETASLDRQTAKAEFFTSGRGGRPSAPSDPLSSSTILDDLRIPASLIANQRPTSPEALPPEILPPETQTPVAVTEATHWHLDSQGRVVLSAAPIAPKTISHCHLTAQP